MAHTLCAWMQRRKGLIKVQGEEENMKEIFELTLFRRATLCIRRVLRREKEEGEGILTAIHTLPLLHS